MTDEPEEAQENKEPEWYGVAITILDDGFNFAIPHDLNPVTLAGMGWYLQEQASIGLRKLMMLQAQAEAANASPIVPFTSIPQDHKGSGGRRRN